MGRAAALAILLFALCGVVVWWAVAEADRPTPRPDGDFQVYVVGPMDVLAQGRVHVEDADALLALQALAARDNFTVRVDDLAGCAYDYVRGVAGHDETATGGWNYYLRRGDGAWAWQDHSASCGGLRVGDDVLWCWVEPDEACAVYP